MDSFAAFLTIHASLFDSGVIIASTKEAVFGSVSPDLIRSLLKERPQNLAILLRKAVSKLTKAASSKGPLKQGLHSPILNCAALITRLLPVLFEGEKEHHFVETVFWRGELPTSSAGSTAAADTKKTVSEVVPDESTREPLAASLIDAILALLFKQEFTCATASDTAVWEGGMGGSAANGKGTQYDAARAEILKLFLISCSETLFVTPGVVALTFSRMCLIRTAFVD
jgi:hypothetical protein